MLSIFYGSDINAVRDATWAYIQKYTETGYEVHRVDVLNYESGMIADLCESVSLFGTPCVYLIDGPRSVSACWEEVITMQDAMANSPSPFVVVEETMTAAEKKRFKVQVEWHESKRAPVERFDTFRLANALAERNKRALWIISQEAKVAGISTEELIGILWWQLKMIRLTQITSSASEAGVKDYPYQKAKQAAQHYPPERIIELMRTLLMVYHDGHGGVRDIDRALESWILNEV